MEKTIKRLIWVYVILLIFEGALRKWVAPSLADPLLIARDPVALAIYLAAIFSGRFPMNGFIVATLALAAASVVASLLAGQDNLLVMIYGLRINYFHVPLIWVIGSVLTREDVEKIGTFLLLVALPMTAIMMMQFNSPMNAPINRGVGGEEGGQIFGAEGRIRPPGFFSFITGPQLFYPLVAAFFLYQASTRRRLWWPILVACGLAILVALPISISRTVMLATGIVGVVFVACLPFTSSFGATLVRAILMTGVIIYGLSFLPIFEEGQRVFLSRWETAAVSSDGDAWGNVITRTLAGFTQPFYWASVAPFFGKGIGVGSNVGARMLSGQLGFLLAEDEWGKIFLELGPLIGGAFIFFRLYLALHLGLKALRVLFSRRDTLPALLFSAAAIPIVQNQWGPPTILGFAILGGGLVLASLKSDEEEEEIEEEEEEEDDEEEEAVTKSPGRPPWRPDRPPTFPSPT